MPNPNEGLVTIHLLIYNHRHLLRDCIESVLSQDYPDIEFILSDNNSSDGSAEFIEKSYPGLTLVRNPENLGYSRAHNRVIRATSGAYFMPLNPDAVLSPGYARELVRAVGMDRSVGMATGKLYRNAERIIDSTGMYFTPALRHLDRGSDEPDHGQYGRWEFVFGVSGAAPLFKREMLEDVQVLGEPFDADFFAYREDADLCWRAQLMGWKAVYAPAATALHARAVLPSNRRHLPAEINLHSVKNRFLMRVKNLTRGVFWKTFPFFILRDVLIAGYILLFEQTSMKAVPLFFRALPAALRKRRIIMRKKAVTEAYLSRWFDWIPRTEPVRDAGLSEDAPGRTESP